MVSIGIMEVVNLAFTLICNASNQAQMQEFTDKMEQLEKSTESTTEQGGAFIEKYKKYTELETY